MADKSFYGTIGWYFRALTDAMGTSHHANVDLPGLNVIVLLGRSSVNKTREKNVTQISIALMYH